MSHNHGSRCSGILLHITSLPSKYGVGDFGPSAFEFVDLLKQAHQTLWQILPINPTSFGNSPYSCTSAFAISPLFVSPELMIRDGFLEERDLEVDLEFSPNRVQYTSVLDFKISLLSKSYSRFSRRMDRDEYERFCVANSYWLEDFCLFSVLKKHFGTCSWAEWPEEIKSRKMVAKYIERFVGLIDQEKYFQFILFRQWAELQAYCCSNDVRIFGDVALFVSHDSADVWAHPEFFKLDQALLPVVVAGVPPDYFSETGQRWGNTVFDWDALRANDFRWWLERMKHNLTLFDLVRIDHFRGLLATWEIPASDATAENGHWQECPGIEFFSRLLKEFESLPIVAEDLGIITQDVKDAMTRFGFPGMKLLVFAFDGDPSENPYAPVNHVKNCVLYTGTHDCNTVRGWFEEEVSEEAREKLEEVLGKKVDLNTVAEEMVALAMGSIADTLILPMQDVLGLGSDARMNCPGIAENNWEWRLHHWSTSDVKKLAELTKTYKRD
ncbi:MAG: 4-alpha-glucanotransferase [Nitrospinae bacterium CG22_combo_CG10-13_8_21_14_all_47_10]|nr:MAG: 4-alpha-glucanotransferase [Nitrospinae bacterium CG22_combo_CG10-13_8_21_14_all_47_10]